MDCVSKKVLAWSGFHPAGDEVLLKKPFTFDLALQKVGQVEDDVAAVAVENALAWRAMGFECHGLRLSCCFPCISGLSARFQGCAGLSDRSLRLGILPLAPVQSASQLGLAATVFSP